MTKDKAINILKLTIKTNGSGCHYQCPHGLNKLTMQVCRLSNEPLHIYRNEATKKDALERTETCKALFKED